MAITVDEAGSPAARAALDGLHARYRGPLISFFQRRLRSRVEAEDLTQEVFYRLARTPAAQEVRNVDAFVFQVAANLLRDHARRASRAPVVGGDVFDAALLDELAGTVDELTPERQAAGTDSLGEVLAALDELGERTRDIFVLFRLENMKQREIAELYGIGVSTVEKHVMRATLHLATRFGHR